MKIKVSQTSGTALDWMVAKATDRLDSWLTVEPGKSAVDVQLHTGRLWVWNGGRPDYVPYEPSANWSQGGPIIEREKLSPQWDKLWKQWTIRDPNNAAWSYMGDTFLIAAMRCFVASRLGDEVDVPEELV